MKEERSMIEGRPARLCQTLFPLAWSISLTCPGGSGSGTLFSRTPWREQKYSTPLCLWFWETQKTVLLKNASQHLTFGAQKKNVTNLQKLAVWLCSTVKPPLTFLPGDFAVIPGHLLVGCGGDQFLQLRSLTDDGLLHGFSLSRKNRRRNWLTHSDW